MQMKNFDVQLFADISNSTSDTVVVGTADADSIYNYAKNVTINALEGNDSINSSSSNAIIYGGSGNDSIKNN
ncbi:MAG: hypothetical protein IJS29_01320, partial [Selenomonadaceae bacterium]|nr:hypothetical protein [Selenomonadaceae bacterium]